MTWYCNISDCLINIPCQKGLFNSGHNIKLANCVERLSSSLEYDLCITDSGVICFFVTTSIRNSCTCFI